MTDSPRIYPSVIGWNRDGKMLFTVSIMCDNHVSIELHEMTTKEIDRFVLDIQEQVGLLLDYDTSDGTNIEENEL